MLKLDLNNLTLKDFEEAEAAPRGCRYDNPCIIGTLIPKDQRGDFDGTVDECQSDGDFKFPDDQFYDACNLQSAFDSRVFDVEYYSNVKEKIIEKYHIR